MASYWTELYKGHIDLKLYTLHGPNLCGFSYNITLSHKVLPLGHLILIFMFVKGIN